jgi:arginyl-tRNA synthetase
MKELIRGLIRDALEEAVRQGKLSLPDEELPSIEVSRSKDPKFGDYATNAPLVLAAKLGMKPRELALIVNECLPGKE